MVSVPRFRFFWVRLFFVLAVLPAAALAQSSTSEIVVSSRPSLTVIHPTEGEQLPEIKQVFVYGAVTPGAQFTINGIPIHVWPNGGYLTVLPVVGGNQLLTCEIKTRSGDMLSLERRFSVAQEPVQLSTGSLTIVKESIEPSGDLWLAPGDRLTVSFQGTPDATAEFSIDKISKHIPMSDRMEDVVSTESLHGLYAGSYILQSTDTANASAIEVQLTTKGQTVHETASGYLTAQSLAVPRIGVITDDVVAVRTGPTGGYDLFLYKGMRVRLTGLMHQEWHVQLSSLQSGWVKDSSVQELPPGTLPPHATLANLSIVHHAESTEIRIPLDEALPYRTEQNLDPTQLTVTLYGAVDRTDLIRYDPQDPLIREVRWKQTSPDTCQLIIDPKFKHWWGYDVRYEDGAMIIEIRKPWTRSTLQGMVIAVDPGHGGFEYGATGNHGTLEKEANLQIAQVVAKTLEAAGAKVVLTRTSDIQVPLYERSRIAWKNKAQLFVSVHCNASGEGENPLEVNGFSTYWYHPQSMALAKAVNARYATTLSIPNHGLYFSDFAVCRMTQMPAILTEQAYIIVPEQEEMIFNAKFRRAVARSILNGIQDFIAQNH